MTKRLISFLIALWIFIAIPLSARYKYNPFTRKLDYYETGADIDLGDLADVTLTGLATGNILYYNGTAWVNLATGANTNVLTLAGGIPSWVAPGVPAAHAASHEVGGADLVDHDQLTNYLAAQHLTLPNTIVAVLTDHNLAAHTALGLFDASADVDHNATTNYFIYNHVGEDHLVDHNLWIGWQAGQDLAVGGQYNTLVGEQAGTDITTGDYNTIVGYQAGFIETTAASATFVGYQAGYNLSNTDGNTAVGHKAMFGVAPTGYGQNTAVGFEAFTSIGEESLRNTVVGYQALSTAEDEAEHITAIGYRAAANLTTPASNSVLIGSYAGLGGVGADYEYNVMIGVDTGTGVTSGSWNTIVGNSAASAITTAAYNVIIGNNASDNNVSGGYNVVIGGSAGLGVAGNSFTNNVIIGYQAAEDITTGTDNIVIGYMAGEGWLDTESEKLVIDVTDTATPLIYGDFSADNISINGDLSVLMDAALDQVLIQQSAVAGTEGQPLIYIDDDRVGPTVSDYTEATIYIDTAANRAIYVSGGYGIEMGGAAGVTVGAGSILGGGSFIWSSKWNVSMDANSTADSIYTFRYYNFGENETSALFFSQENPDAMTWTNDWESPTFVITNSEGADTNDFAAVVIGERAQGDVAVAHYFDFWATVNHSDAAADATTTEIGATFRFGDAGSAVPDYATGPGDVLFEDDIEIDGNTWFDANAMLIDDVLLNIGTNSDASIEYDETTNDALIVGVPSTNQRGIILVDKADIAADLTAVILTAAQPRFNMVDADLDSNLTFGFYGDDTPNVQSRLHTLNINWGAEQGVYFFSDSDTTENQEVRIYGYDDAQIGAMYGSMFVDTAGKYNITAQEGPIIFNRELRVPVDLTDVSNPPTDAELDAAFGTPATVGVGFWSYINDNGAGNNFYTVVSDGTNWWIFTGTKAI